MELKRHVTQAQKQQSADSWMCDSWQRTISQWNNLNENENKQTARPTHTHTNTQTWREFCMCIVLSYQNFAQFLWLWLLPILINLKRINDSTLHWLYVCIAFNWSQTNRSLFLFSSFDCSAEKKFIYLTNSTRFSSTFIYFVLIMIFDLLW